MRYPEQLIIPMRKDLTQYGVQETRTPEEVNQALRPGSGTVLMVVNSVCGCAAGKARPAVGLALGASRPSRCGGHRVCGRGFRSCSDSFANCFQVTRPLRHPWLCFAMASPSSFCIASKSRPGKPIKSPSS